MSGLPWKKHFLGSRTAQPNGVGTMHQPPTQTLGMSRPRLTARVSQTTSSSPMRTVLSPRRSTLPFSRWNATAYDAVNGPKLPLSEADSLKESRSCSKSAVNAGSEAAMVAASALERGRGAVIGPTSTSTKSLSMSSSTAGLCGTVVVGESVIWASPSRIPKWNAAIAIRSRGSRT